MEQSRIRSFEHNYYSIMMVNCPLLPLKYQIKWTKKVKLTTFTIYELKKDGALQTSPSSSAIAR